MKKTKRMLSIILLLFIIISIIINIFSTLLYIVYADDIDDIEDIENEEDKLGTNLLYNIEELKTLETSARLKKEPIINSKSAIIFDRQTKTVLWAKEQNTKRAMASTTKIMTAIVVIETCNLNDIVTISKKAAGTGGSRLKINTGDKITVKDLLYGLMLRSGNDAAVALAEYVGGSIDGFSKLMNDKAKMLGLKNTNFVTPHGLDNENHYTTAYELAVLTDYALNSKTFSEIVSTKTYTIKVNDNNITISNTNELLGNVNGVNGVKTGFTGKAMRCLVTSCKRNNDEIITVVLGADTKKDRTYDSIKLIEYAYSNFEKINIEEIVNEEFENWKHINQNRIYIYKGRKNIKNSNNLELKLSEIKNKIAVIKNEEEETEKRKGNISIDINCINRWEAPIDKDTIIGNITIKNNDKIIEIIDIITANKVERKSIIDYMLQFLVNFQTCLDF